MHPGSGGGGGSKEQGQFIAVSSGGNLSSPMRINSNRGLNTLTTQAPPTRPPSRARSSDQPRPELCWEYTAVLQLRKEELGAMSDV